MTNTTNEPDQVDTLAAVAKLLHHAAFRAWEQAQAAGPRSPLHLLGLGIHVASCQAVSMLPAGTDLGGYPPTQDDVEQLLRAAAELAQDIPFWHGPVGISILVAAICDLVREVSA